MADTKVFQEGVESYRRRLINELQLLNSNIDGFVDIRNDPFDIRKLIIDFRRSLEKCNNYISYIEDINEKKIKEVKGQVL